MTRARASALGEGRHSMLVPQPVTCLAEFNQTATLWQCITRSLLCRQNIMTIDISIINSVVMLQTHTIAL